MNQDHQDRCISAPTFTATKEDDYLYHGYGFPILLNRVRVMSNGVDTFPLINHMALEPLVLRELAMRPGRISGDELRFIHTSCNIIPDKFPAQQVQQWEDQRANPTEMPEDAEVYIRVAVLLRLGKPEDALCVLRNKDALLATERYAISVAGESISFRERSTS